MNEPQITPELVASHGLKPDEYERILKFLDRHLQEGGSPSLANQSLVHISRLSPADIIGKP
jgi:hypothetical protein